MPSKYHYHHTLRNEYLGVSKTIRATTEQELDWLIRNQLTKWADQETRKKQQRRKEADRKATKEHIEGLKAQAEQDSELAKQAIISLKSILVKGVKSDLSIDWDHFLYKHEAPRFTFEREKPDKEAIRLQILGPKPAEELVLAPVTTAPHWLELFLPFIRSRRLAREAEAAEQYARHRKEARIDFVRRFKEYKAGSQTVMDAYRLAVRDYNSALSEARRDYQRTQEAFAKRRDEHNSSVIRFRTDYQAGATEAVERFAKMSLERSSYPEPIDGDVDVAFDEAARTLVVTFWLPNPSEFSSTSGYKYVASRKSVEAVELKPKDFESLYDDVIHQIALRTIHEVFEADHAKVVEAVVFNGWVRGIDRRIGKNFTSCILTCYADRESFRRIDLAHVSPKECVRGLKGITAGPLSMLAPVKPILELNRDDDRFVESKEIIERLNPHDNLAAMEWEDFEHLVRELFESEFAKSGGEVRVTQASRDRGVNAIAFDPDPIRGGKFVIQAKRYNMVVPVSAVRDLYGTMIAEGAAKGILVTTSYFGRDNREFAMDKPIALIDGENLVHMFQQHGHHVHIALLPKGDPHRGLGQHA